MVRERRPVHESTLITDVGFTAVVLLDELEKAHRVSSIHHWTGIMRRVLCIPRTLL